MGTQITDTGAQAVLALRSMEANAFRVSQVTTRLLDQHANALPELLAVRPEATHKSAAVVFQPRTVEDANQWAAALGVELVVEDVDGYRPGCHFRESRGTALVDGVTVWVSSSQSYSPEAWAELTAAEAVAV